MLCCHNCCDADELWLTLVGMVVVWGVLLWAMLKAWAWIRRDRAVRWNSLSSAILYGFGALMEDPPHRPPTNPSAQVRNSSHRAWDLAPRQLLR